MSLRNSLEKKLAVPLVAVGLYAASCAPALQTIPQNLTMPIITYSSDLDGAKIYSTAEQFKAPEVQAHFIQKMIEANNAYFRQNPRDGREEDWRRIRELIYSRKPVVAEPTEGGLVFALEGFSQILDRAYQQEHLVNGQVDRGERIPNYNQPEGDQITDGHYQFPFARVENLEGIGDLETARQALLSRSSGRNEK